MSDHRDGQPSPPPEPEKDSPPVPPGERAGDRRRRPPANPFPETGFDFPEDGSQDREALPPSETPARKAPRPSGSSPAAGRPSPAASVPPKPPAPPPRSAAPSSSEAPSASAEGGVPFVDLRVQYDQLKDELDSVVRATLEKGDFINGAHCGAFEKELAASLGVEHAVGMASCTAATVLGLKALGIGTGDEVITCTHTYVATAEAILAAGARVRLVDIKPDTHLMDPEEVERAVTPRTRAIIAVHLYGTPCDMDAIMALAEAHNLKVIEDCAQSQGSSYKGHPLGSIGHAAAFSFFPSKNLGAAGDAGALCTNNPEVASMARMMANHGRKEKFLHEVVGGNHRLDTLQAGILRVKLPHLASWNETRRNAAKLYFELLADCPGLGLPYDAPDAVTAWHVFAVQVDKPQEVAAALKRRGIGTGYHYPTALHEQPVLKYLGFGPGSMPNAERYCARTLSLPLFAGITEDQVRRAAAAVREVMEERAGNK